MAMIPDDLVDRASDALSRFDDATERIAADRTGNDKRAQEDAGQAADDMADAIRLMLDAQVR